MRLVMARGCFAAAGRAIGGVFGPTRLERLLGISPSARAERASPARDRSKNKKPTSGLCKRWLRGIVPQAQTISQIAQDKPRVARAIRRWLSSPLLQALAKEPPGTKFSLQQMRWVSEEAAALYCAWKALGHCNPQFESRLVNLLSQQAFRQRGFPLLVACLIVERQEGRPLNVARQATVNRAFTFALGRTCTAQVEVTFAKEHIVRLREARLLQAADDLVDGQPTLSEPSPNFTRLDQEARERQLAHVKEVLMQLEAANTPLLNGTSNVRAQRRTTLGSS
jgi:hypothetical protein